MQIKCGTGTPPNLSQIADADTANRGTGYVGQGRTALAFRRAWAIALTVPGWMLFSVLTVALWRPAPTGHHPTGIA